MYYSDESHTAYLLGGMAIGLLVGAGITILAAPRSGRRTRRRLKHAMGGAVGSFGDQWEDLGDDLKTAVERGRKRLNLGR